MQTDNKIEFKIKGKTYIVLQPTIRDYYELQTQLVLQDVNAKINIVSKLSGCDVKTLRLLDKYQFIELWNVLLERHFNISESTPFHRNFILNGKFYGFLDMDTISLGEFADLDVLGADPQSQKKLHIIMAILYRPAIAITEKWIKVDEYDSNTLTQRGEEFLDLPLKYVYGALNFFLQMSSYLYGNILDCLNSQIPETMLQKELLEMSKQIILKQLEVGTESSSSAQEMTFRRMTKLAELVLSESSTTLHTDQIKGKNKKHLIDRWSLNSVYDKIKNKIK